MTRLEIRYLYDAKFMFTAVFNFTDDNAPFAECHYQPGDIQIVEVSYVQSIDKLLLEAGFVLYDITQLSRLKDGTLGWFYPVYINKKLDNVRPQAFWDEKDNDAVVQVQVERRKAILKSNSELLNRLRHRDKNVGRNDPCPCGSGRKFKHCCGTFGT